MSKIVNLFLIIVIFIFFYCIVSYYFSKKNIKDTNLNRVNIDQILKKKSSSLPVLSNNTENIIEFNSTFSKEIREDKPRNFWNLLKSK